VVGTATHQQIAKTSTTPSAQWVYCVCLVPPPLDPNLDPAAAAAAAATVTTAGPHRCQASILEDCQATELTTQQQATLQRGGAPQAKVDGSAAAAAAVV
jgi:hypothetical protein